MLRNLRRAGWMISLIIRGHRSRGCSYKRCQILQCGWNVLGCLAHGATHIRHLSSRPPYPTAPHGEPATTVPAYSVWHYVQQGKLYYLLTHKQSRVRGNKQLVIKLIVWLEAARPRATKPGLYIISLWIDDSNNGSISLAFLTGPLPSYDRGYQGRTWPR